MLHEIFSIKQSFCDFLIILNQRQQNTEVDLDLIKTDNKGSSF